MFNFSPAKEAVVDKSNVAPAGSLSWALVEVKNFNPSNNTGGAKAELELTLYQGPWEGRKIFGVHIGDPRDELNSEAFRQMGFNAILLMAEATGLVDVRNPDSYAWLNVTPFNDIMTRFDGKVVGVKLSIKKDKDGVYPDKNQVGEWLSPNPARKSNKAWVALCEGKSSMKPALPAGPTAAARATFGANVSEMAPPAAGAASPQGGFGAAQQGTVTPMIPAQPATSAGFGKAAVPPAAMPQPQAAMQQPQPPNMNAGLTAPSANPLQGAGNFNNAPAWLKNGQQDGQSPAAPNGAGDVPFA